MRRFRITAFMTSFLFAAGVALTGATHAQAAATGYVALGDSYSSGVGSGSYTSESGDCKRSTKAYPALWAAAHSPSSFNFTACSGARTGDVLSSQLAPLGAGTGLVSLSIGGNDAGFADVMTTCVLQSEATCLSRINTARAYVTSTLPANLDKVYDAITARAPAAHVVVIGYPRFYKLSGSCIAGLSENERSAINSASDLLNTTIAKRVADHGFTFGDVRPAFSGHEICSGDSWLHSVNWTNIGESYHPTAAGQSGGYLPVFNSNA
ncbi:MULTISPECIES: SGNH/GDSL hydrolase family protein [unclassified Streptomyces]|uniref:SGNH/GDSL hydrolase family protein n=1 Tax=unclassified Streptomyces TaxID=2593676 RepID=UPI000DBA9E9D|nr:MULTISPECIES: SGNH/GDSL hydrolase family protein [unclassified Streptomyces]MYT72843.1 lipase [Streptomyces sp. SID8367]RAJ78820.1 GDSL-like lipase/acylhydrolase family protein [Streptomyces sp. PsTaAH-137]